MMAPRLARLLAPAAALALAAACNTSRPPAAPTTMPDPPMAPAAPAPEPAPAPAPVVPETARYQAIFDATWSRASHPQDPPDDPHFSPLIGATHRNTVSFWAPGQLATPGIRFMAERGARSPLTDEIAAAVAQGHAQFTITRDGQFDSPDRITIEFDVTQAFPLVTLVTMVAPSPDWFVGSQSLPLFENGAWRDEVRIDLHPYDAGTDRGESFMSADDEARPAVPIARIMGFPFLVGSTVPPLGTLTFRRVQ